MASLERERLWFFEYFFQAFCSFFRQCRCSLILVVVCFFIEFYSSFTSQYRNWFNIYFNCFFFFLVVQFINIRNIIGNHIIRNHKTIFLVVSLVMKSIKIGSPLLAPYKYKIKLCVTPCTPWCKNSQLVTHNYLLNPFAVRNSQIRSRCV